MRIPRSLATALLLALVTPLLILLVSLPMASVGVQGAAGVTPRAACAGPNPCVTLVIPANGATATAQQNLACSVCPFSTHGPVL